MKSIYTHIFTSLMLLFACVSIIAQEEIIFSPADLIPHDDGYYVSGVWVDENEDGVMEFHNGCDDYYEDEPDGSPDWFYNPHENHAETGEQQGFKYVNCMIMPTCEHKSEPIDPPVALGYIQLHACLWSNTDSAIISYIQTPPVSNLVSLTLETSSDVSINPSRSIPYNIEYSKDYGTTWEYTYLSDHVLTQGGSRITYDGSIYYQFEEMMNASTESPIVLRIITNDRAVAGSEQGQFVKVHLLKLTADLVTSVNRVKTGQPAKYQVRDLTITVVRSTLQVYNLTGQLIGSGTKVTVPYSGIYIVRLTDMAVHKVYIK
jgi:hypothetical protein